MGSRERRSVAAAWLAKYGEPIDCEELRRMAAPTTAALGELMGAITDAAPELADLLERQAREITAFVRRKPAKGRSSSLAEQARRLREAERREGRTVGGLRPFPFALLSEHLAIKARIASALRHLRGASHAAPSTTRAAHRDAAFAALGISEWIRARHRNRRGGLDGKTCWPDVERCLAWHGGPGADDAALRQRARRARAELGRAPGPQALTDDEFAGLLIERGLVPGPVRRRARANATRAAR